MKVNIQIPKGWRKLFIGETGRSGDRVPYYGRWEKSLFIGIVRKGETIIRKLPIRRKKGTNEQHQ